MESKHSLLKSFQFAFQGISTEFKKGRNFRIQIISGILASIIGIILKLDPTQWAVLITIISVILILELINTAIEEIVDMVSPEIRPEAKIAKDVSAASVLVASIAAIFIGLFLFLPKLM